MQNEPEISVICAVKNGAETVGKTVESVLAQSMPDLELIAVDDGSDDGTADILLAAASRDSRVRVIRQENAGVSAARNRGLDAARGRYAAFADSDDVTGPDWLMSLMKGMQENGGRGMSVCGYETERNGKIARTAEFTPEELTPAEAMRRCLRYRDLTTAVWNKMFLTETLNREHIRFRKEYRIGEDMVFIAEYITKIRSVRVVSGHDYLYRDNGEGAMGSLKRGSGFRSSFIDEWEAALAAEKILAESGIVLRETDIKKLRIAGKLLPLLEAYGLGEPGLKKDLQSTLRSHPGMILKEPEFDRNRRLFMILGALSPGLSGAVRRFTWKRQKQDY